MVGLPYFRSHSKSWPFETQPHFDHSKSRLVWISDPHCRELSVLCILPDKNELLIVVQKPRQDRRLCERLTSEWRCTKQVFEMKIFIWVQNIIQINMCCVFWPAFGCCAHPKAGWITFFLLFSTFFVHRKPFSVISCMKSTKMSENEQKKTSTSFRVMHAPKSWSRYTTNMQMAEA